MDTKVLQQMIERGQDSALLRVTLAQALQTGDQTGEALTHARAAVQLDPNYSAAWKLLAELHLAEREIDEASAAYDAGIACADRQGDEQLLKMMQVFKRRLDKNRAHKNETPGAD